MPKKKIILIIIISIFLFLVPSCRFVFAQDVPLQSLQISPVINDLQLSSGKTTSFKIYVKNLSKNPLGIQVSISGFDETGGENIFQTPPSRIINWTTVRPTQLLLSPLATNALLVSIKTPKGLGSSGYYETIFLTPISQQTVSPDSQIILSRLGVLILGTLGKLNYHDLADKVTISQLLPSSTILNTQPSAITFNINNKYFTHFDAKPFLTIIPFYGKRQTVLLADKHILPDNAKSWEVPIQDIPYSPFYKIQLSVSIGNGIQIHKDVWFIVLPYQKIIILLFLILIAFLIIFKRNRLRKAWHILKKGS